jgi:hypothetical protein
VDAAAAQAQIVRTLVDLLAVVPVLALEAKGWPQEPATRALVAAIYAFGGTRDDVNDALERGRENLRKWREHRDRSLLEQLLAWLRGQGS